MTATWDVAAFEALFRAHYAGVCAFVARLVRSRAVAEELAQDVFASVWAHRDELRVHTSARAYLYGAARNRALNWLEREGLARDWAERERLTLVRAADPAADPTSAQAQLEAADLRRQLERALDLLPARCRLVMRLRYIEQMSYAEIAEAMAISVKGVENQLGRGLKALRPLLGELVRE